MKIIVLGTRGIPDVPGGVETHCEALYPRLVKLGCDVTLITRTPYIAKDQRLYQYQGVKLRHLFAPRKKSLEAIVHTFLGILYARLKSPDVLHIHAIGPSIMVPLARLLGLKTIFTHHGPDYDRQKWGRLGKWVLIQGERMGARFANSIIVISTVIGEILSDKYDRHDHHLIFNGVDLPDIPTESDYIRSLGLEPGKYMIGVGRFVGEKGFHDLIDAYQKAEIDDHKLVLVGDADHETRYSRDLKQQANAAGVVMTGYIKGRELAQTFAHARLFCMPSYHEGLPIALLEAMSYNLPVLVSDIPANLQVKLDEANYHKTGDIDDLAEALARRLQTTENVDNSELLTKHYNWDVVAAQTLDVYRSVCENNSRAR
jgi:glycosyltransferase involved in cell wall biosynthesis